MLVDIVETGEDYVDPQLSNLHFKSEDVTDLKMETNPKLLQSLKEVHKAIVKFKKLEKKEKQKNAMKVVRY